MTKNYVYLLMVSMPTTNQIWLSKKKSQEVGVVEAMKNEEKLIGSGRQMGEQSSAKIPTPL